MNTSHTPATPETTLVALNAAALAGDEEVVDRHWREFVRMLWATMPPSRWVKDEVVDLP